MYMSDAGRFGTVTAAAKTAEKNATLFAAQKTALASHGIAAKILRQKWPSSLDSAPGAETRSGSREPEEISTTHANTPLAETASMPARGQSHPVKTPLEKDGVKYFNTDMPTFVVLAENAIEVLSFFRDNKDFNYDFLLDLTSVDFLHSPRVQDTEENNGKRFQVVYILQSMLSDRRGARIRICVPVDENEEAPSMTSLWPGADWPEREVFDLMGIRFSGHPNLRRIVLPDNYRGHPLRKDFPVKGIGEDYLIEDLLYKRRNVD